MNKVFKILTILFLTSILFTSCLLSQDGTTKTSDLTKADVQVAKKVSVSLVLPTINWYLGGAAAASMSPNKWDVFATQHYTGNLLQLSVDGANSSVTNFGSKYSFNGPVSTISRQTGKFDIFGLNANNRLHQIHYNGNFYDAQVRNTTGYRYQDAVIATSWSSDRIDVFGWGANNELLQCYWTPGTGFGWSQHTGAFNGFTVSGPIAGTSWGPNRIDLFVLDGSGGLVQRYYNGSKWVTGRLDFKSNGVYFHSSVTVTSRSANTLDVFGLGGGGALVQAYFDGTNWHSKKFAEGMFYGEISAASRNSNEVTVFGRSWNGNTKMYAYSGSQWEEHEFPRGFLGQ